MNDQDLIARLSISGAEYAAQPGDSTRAAFAAAVKATHEALATQAAELERLREHLRFVERWANHHGGKPNITPAEVLSTIQHYPPIKEITRSYADGVVPDTFDPWAELERLRAVLQRIADCCPGDSHFYTLASVGDLARTTLEKP